MNLDVKDQSNTYQTMVIDTIDSHFNFDDPKDDIYSKAQRFYYMLTY